MVELKITLLNKQVIFGSYDTLQDCHTALNQWFKNSYVIGYKITKGLK